MNKFFTLLKVQFLSYFGINKILNSKKYKFKGAIGIALLLVFLGALICGAGYLYALSFAETLMVTEGSAKGVIPLMVSIAAVASLIFSFYSSGSVLYGFKDYDTLSAMPVKTSTVVLSKLTFTFITDLLFGILIVIPSVIVYSNFNGGIDFLTVARLLTMILFLPFFPMVISIVLGAVGVILSSRFKHKNLIQFLFMFIVFVGYYALSLIFSMEDGSTFVFIEKTFFLSGLVKAGLVDWIHVVIFCGACLLSGAIVMAIVCVTYKKINTLVTSVKKSGNFKMKVYGGKSQFTALTIKEIKRLFSSATYALNTLLGPIMVIMFTVIIIVMCVSDPSFSFLLPLIAPPIYAFTLMIAPTTVCSISVEGSSFWIMRTSPIKTTLLLNIKLAVNLFFSAIPALVSGIAFAVLLFKTSVVYALLVPLVAVLTAALGGNMGLIFNLLFPLMKWDNINKAVKQGTSSFFTVLISMVLAAVEGVLLYFAIPDFTLTLSLIAVALIIFTVSTFAVLYKYGESLIIKKT